MNNCVFTQDKKNLWNIEWECKRGPVYLDIYSEMGLLVEEYYNRKIGLICFMYVIPEQMDIDSNKINTVFENINKKTNENCPYIIYEDVKYKDECKKWNNGNNTVIEKKEFETMINTIK
jgi:hypothetical protein